MNIRIDYIDYEHSVYKQGYNVYIFYKYIEWLYISEGLKALKDIEWGKDQSTGNITFIT